MLSKFQFSFEQLEITREEVAEFMGFESDLIPEPFPGMIDYLLELATSLIKPTGGFRVYKNVIFNIAEKTIKIEGKDFHPSDIVIKQLLNASHLAVFLSTAGDQITMASKEAENNGDLMTGYVLDVIGSVAADKTAELVHQEIEKESQIQGSSVSDRFSPGYCEWSVKEQQVLFELINGNDFNISLSESSLMYPIKSVSGIIGIGQNLSRKGYQCFWCTDKQCFAGKINRKKKMKKN